MGIILLTINHKPCKKTQEFVVDYTKRLQNIKFVEDNIKLALKKNQTVMEIINSQSQALVERLETKYSKFAQILLDERGMTLSSQEFASSLQKWLNDFNSVVFIIGGAYGVSTQLKQMMKCKISLSAMTYPHNLAKIIIAEQLYRACSILAEHPYHKE